MWGRIKVLVVFLIVIIDVVLIVIVCGREGFMRVVVVLLFVKRRIVGMMREVLKVVLFLDFGGGLERDEIWFVMWFVIVMGLLGFYLGVLVLVLKGLILWIVLVGVVEIIVICFFFWVGILVFLVV